LIPGLLLVAIIFLIACAVVRTLRAFFDRIEEGSARVTWIDAETALKNATVWACVQYRSAALAQLPWRVMREDPKRGCVPAPTNLVIPPYRFDTAGTKVTIGEDTKAA